MHYCFIRTDNKYVKINFEEILYVEACGNYIKVVTAQRSFLALLSLRQMEKALPHGSFCRVHRSYIISLNHIMAFDHEWVYLESGQIPLGEQYKNFLQEKVIILMSEVRSPAKIWREYL